MRLPEQRFWDRTRARLAADFRLERIENLAAVGTPDVLATARATGRTSLIELKAVVGLPTRLTTRVLGRGGLSQDQKNWHLDFARAKGKAYILIGVGGNRQFLVPGAHADSVNEWNIVQLQDNALATEWPDIKSFLTDGEV